MCCQRDCERKLSINRSGSALILVVFNRLAWLQNINVTIQQEGSKKKKKKECKKVREPGMCVGEPCFDVIQRNEGSVWLTLYTVVTLHVRREMTKTNCVIEVFKCFLSQLNM